MPRSSRIAGSATLTTVPSRKTTADPRIAATRVSRLARASGTEPTMADAASVPDRMTPPADRHRGRRRCRDHGGGRLEDVPSARTSATRRSRSARCTRSARASSTSCTRSDDVSFDGRPGRVLRDRGPQRQRQEHAAQVPGRDLRGGRRDHDASTGRLSPFIELGVGFNPELTARDNVLINAIMLGLSRAEARRAVRRDHRLRRAGGVRRPQAQELLVRHARAARVRRRRSQVDADVLLIDEVLAVGDAAFQQKCFDRLHAAQGGRPHDRLRHARHARGRAVLRPRDAARARPDRRRRRPAPHRRGLQRDQLRSLRPGDVGGRALRRPDGGRDHGGLVRGRRRRADRRARPGRAAADARWRSASAPRSRSRSSASRCPPRGRPERVRDAHRLARHPDRTTSRPATSPSCAWRSTTGSRRAATGSPRRSLARGPASTRSTRARTSRTLTVHGTGNTGGLVDLPHEVEIERRDRRALAPGRRRHPALLGAGLDPRRDRLAAALLRVGARLPVDAGAPVRVLRRHLRGVHGDRQHRRRHQGLRHLHPVLDGAVPVLQRGDERLGDVGRAAREPAAQDALPAAGDPAQHGR